MAKREYGYTAIVPVFIPVDKNNTQNQIDILRALMEAGRGGTLEAITSLPGVRLAVKPGKDIMNRYGSVPVVEAEAQEVSENPNFAPADETNEVAAPDAELMSQAAYNETTDEPAADEVNTTGRRRARAAV